MDYNSCISKCMHLEKKAISFIGKHDKIFEEINGQVNDFKYGKGGCLIHRGYFCPSPIRDVIIGNAKRGRLLRQHRSTDIIDYKYGFDSNKMLRMIVYIQKRKNEFVFYDNSTELSVVYDKNNNVAQVSECIYAFGKIISYAMGLFDEYTKRIREFYCENYIYSLDGISKADICTLYPKLDLDMFSANTYYSHQVFHFEHDIDGYLSSYSESIFDENQGVFLRNQSHKNEVSVKRKV